ncbi:MAG: hypothetical protein KAS32_16400 [Candidatus Peribacteraceae bacterium]|nr:hypothetical protein [Candidatus Peribacteraceae bacterium]
MKNFLTLSILLFIPFGVSAATIRAGDELLVTMPIQDDLYVAGGTVGVEKNISGDLHVAGGDIFISGDVSEDVIIVGGDVGLQGNIGDDLRIAGGNISLSGSVDEDAILAGRKIIIFNSAVIMGDARIFGGDIMIDGTIGKDLYIRGGNIRINGVIEGNVDIQSESLVLNATIGGDAKVSAKNLSIVDTTQIVGNLNYWNPNGELVHEAQVGGKTVFDLSLAIKQMPKFKNAIPAFFIGVFSYSLLASAFIILLAILFTKTYFLDSAKRLNKATGMSIWYGFLYVVVTPVLAFVFFMTLIGIPIGLLLIIAYLISFFLVKAMTSIVFARLIEIKLKKKWGNAKLFFVSFAILFVWKIIVFIPIAGTIVSAIALLAGFGALSHTEWEKWKKVR